jgi:hypothetical protein
VDLLQIKEKQSFGSVVIEERNEERSFDSK